MEQKSNHTPGPWGHTRPASGLMPTDSSGNRYIGIGPTGKNLALVEVRHGEAAATANARLIAAAPDLLATLEEIERVANCGKCTCGPESPADHWGECPLFFRERARAAIVKARGE